jgi:hypothetical protein
MQLSMIPGGYRLFRRFDIGSRLHPRPPDDRSDGVLAETKIAGDPAITAALGNERQHFGCQAVGLRAVANLPPKLPAPRPCRSASGANSLAQQALLPSSGRAAYRPRRSCRTSRLPTPAARQRVGRTSCSPANTSGPRAPPLRVSFRP